MHACPTSTTARVPGLNRAVACGGFYLPRLSLQQQWGTNCWDNTAVQIRVPAARLLACPACPACYGWQAVGTCGSHTGKLPLKRLHRRQPKHAHVGDLPRPGLNNAAMSSSDLIPPHPAHHQPAAVKATAAAATATAAAMTQVPARRDVCRPEACRPLPRHFSRW